MDELSLSVSEILHLANLKSGYIVKVFNYFMKEQQLSSKERLRAGVAQKQLGIIMELGLGSLRKEITIRKA